MQVGCVVMLEVLAIAFRGWSEKVELCVDYEKNNNMNSGGTRKKSLDEPLKKL
jgi:hypothetical protein